MRGLGGGGVLGLSSTLVIDIGGGQRPPLGAQRAPQALCRS